MIREASGLALRWVWVAFLVSASGCSWHRVDVKTSAPHAEKKFGRLGLIPADPETSLTDMQSIAQRLQSSGAFEGIQFPYRAGDAVDQTLEIRLRQGVDLHRAENFFRSVAIGLTLCTISPWLGNRVTYSLDVHMRLFHGSSPQLEDGFIVKTPVTFGQHANVDALARDTDKAQIDQVVRALLDRLEARAKVSP